MLQTELHRHLDVSIRTQTLLEFAQQKGLVSLSTSREAFEDKLLLREPLADLEAVLARFNLYQKVLDRHENIERATFEAVEDCWNEGTTQVEFRYSPSFVGEYSSLSWTEALQAFQKGLDRGLKQFPLMKAGLICIASRDYGIEEVCRTLEFYQNHAAEFIGIDLAGNEVHYPCSLYETAFKRLREGLPKALSSQITIHAGEASGPDNIWQAVDLLGARRIGHGIACIQDPQLLNYLAQNQICLEVCPTSNWLTQSVPILENHPLPQILRAGVPVCINTDDPGNSLKMSPAEIELCKNYAVQFSFLRSA